MLSDRLIDAEMAEVTTGRSTMAGPLQACCHTTGMDSQALPPLGRAAQEMEKTFLRESMDRVAGGAVNLTVVPALLSAGNATTKPLVRGSRANRKPMVLRVTQSTRALIGFRAPAAGMACCPLLAIVFRSRTSWSRIA